jgi:gas vesicle protein
MEVRTMRHKEFWIALGIGAAAGGIVALLYAPQAGVKTRKQLRRGIDDAGEALEEAAEYLKKQADYLTKEAQKLIDSGKDQFNAAVDTASDYASTASKAARKLV